MTVGARGALVPICQRERAVDAMHGRDDRAPRLARQDALQPMALQALLRVVPAVRVIGVGVDVHSRWTPPRGQRFACYTGVVSEKQIDEVAKELAEAHRKEDPSTTAVFLAEDRAEVRLVEVSGSIVTSGEVLPFRFAARPDRGVPYPSVVVLLSEDDWARIERGDLELPPGWGTPATLKKIA